MKKLLNLTWVVLICLLSLPSRAQEISMLSTTVGRSSIPIAAIRDFNKRSSFAANSVWHKVPAGWMVYGYDADKKTIARYDRQGVWQFNTVSYRPALLPREISRRIRTEYLDFTLTWVNEYQDKSGNTYFIQMEDGKTFIQVRLNPENEIEPIKTFTLSHPKNASALSPWP
jgi:hypothetical protein